MTTIRTVTAIILGSALGLTLSTIGPAAGAPVEGEPASVSAAPTYCPRHGAGDNHVGVPAGLTVGQYINRLDFACG